MLGLYERETKDVSRFFFMNTILIGSVNYDGKEYCFERWLNAISKITYQPVSVLVVDTSDELGFHSRWHNQVPMIHLDIRGTGDQKIATGMEHLREIFLARKIYSHWLNIEGDILVPPYVVDVMLYQSQGVDFASAPYKHRVEDRWIDGCFGCSMFSQRIAEVDFVDAPKDSHTDVWWRNKVLGKYRINDMPRHVLHLEHLNG